MHHGVSNCYLFNVLLTSFNQFAQFIHSHPLRPIPSNCTYHTLVEGAIFFTQCCVTTEENGLCVFFLNMDYSYYFFLPPIHDTVYKYSSTYYTTHW